MLHASNPAPRHEPLGRQCDRDEPGDGPTATRLSLGDLVGDVDRFADACWGRAPHRHAVPRPERLLGLIDVAAIDGILDTTARTPSIRMVRAGARIGEADYTRRVRIAGRELRDVVDADAVRSRFAAGETIVLQGLHRTWPAVRHMALALESELDHPVQVNAYLSPPSAAGLPRHADVHDVFVVQVDGRKHWNVTGLGALALEPGDVLYLPRGTEHEATTGAGHSLHLTIGVPATTQRDVLRRLVDRLDDDRLDRQLPLGFTRRLGHELRSSLADSLADSLAAVVGAAGDGDGIVDREVARVRRRRRAGSPSLSAVVASSAVTETSVLVPRPGADAVLDRLPDALGRCVLRTGSTTLRMPEHARPALVRVLGCERVSATDLDTLTVVGATVLLRRLVRDGVLEVA